MRISFDNRDLADIKKATEAYSSAPEIRTKGASFSYSVESAIPDNRSYENKKATLNEFKDTIKDVDVALNQDYMTVMAHTASSEDYGRMMKDGVNPMDCEVSDSVTILDRIKLDVALGGGEIEGFTDTLDKETVEAMTGSASLPASDCGLEIPAYNVTVDNETIKESVEAFKQLSDVTEMTEGMKKFFLSSEKELSVANLYLAKHSSDALTSDGGRGARYFTIDDKGHLAKRAEGSDHESLKAEVKDLLTRLEIPADEETVENGTWLVDNSICVNKENIEKLAEINSVSLPISKEDYVKLAAIAFSEGKSPADAVVTRTDSFYNEAVRLTRVLEETRLKMTSEANLVLLKSDYHIDTKDLEAYVETLKKVEDSAQYKELKAVSEVKETIAEIRSLPAAVIASLSFSGRTGLDRPTEGSGEISSLSDMTLQDIKDRGLDYKSRFEQAFETYETVGTEVRRDLGDSIRKAFRNVDEILKETGFEPTEQNRRAVRILGYNSMPITKESVEKIKEADAKLSAAINRITPEDTLKLIRSGRSPIKMSVGELNEYLDAKEDVAKEEIEKYSKFLYKLERNNGITEAERKEFIEVYRLFHKLEKTDCAAIGSILNAGGELTLGNLKTAVKTANSRGMDVKVDDSFGLLVSDIRNELSPERISAIEFSDGTSLDTLYKNLSEAEVSAQYEEDWNRRQYREMKEAMKAPEEVVTELVMNKVPVTANNLRAAWGLMKRKNDVFFNDLDSDITEEIERIPEEFETAESAGNAYNTMIERAKESIYETAMNRERFIDVRALQLAFSKLTVARRYSESETYEIPMELDGEKTSINLKVVHNPDEEANVVISSETEDLGRFTARLNMKDGEVKGYIACFYKDTVTKMEKVADILGGGVKAVYSKTSDTDATLSKIPMRRNSDSVSTEDLYKTAKRFLLALKNI